MLVDLRATPRTGGPERGTRLVTEERIVRDINNPTLPQPRTNPTQPNPTQHNTLM